MSSAPMLTKPRQQGIAQQLFSSTVPPIALRMNGFNKAQMRLASPKSVVRAMVRSGSFASNWALSATSGLASTTDLPDAIAIFAFGPQADIERMTFYFPPQQTQTNAEAAPGKLPRRMGGLRKPNGSGTK